MAEKIVVIGGGYAGILTTKKLYKKLKKEIKSGDVEITMIDKNPYHSLLTELHEVAFERTQRDSIKIYYDKVFKKRKINVVLDEVTSIDYDNKIVKTKSNTDYEYTKVVQAVGSTPCHFNIPGAEEYTFPLWSVKDAQDLNKVILDRFMAAEQEADIEKRKELLTFVVAGAGFTGIEVVGELEEWISRSLLNEFTSITRDEVRIVIIDGASDVLSAFDEKATYKVRKRLDKRNIEVVLDSFICEVKPDEVIHSNYEGSIKTQTVIWTSGITNEPISADELEKGRNNRIVVNEHLESVSQDDLYAIGDLMWFVPKGDTMSVPQMVENCEHAAPVLATNIANDIKGSQDRKEYDPSFHGAMACIGGRYGVAEIQLGSVKLVFGLFFAMFIKHIVNMLYFFSAGGFTKIWHYIKDEFFYVKDRRSMVGGHLSAQKPSIYLVPLRMFLGFYWIKQGFPKVYRDLTGGWEEVCTPTDFSYSAADQNLQVCQDIAAEQAKEDASSSATTESGESAEATDASSTSTETGEAATETGEATETVVVEPEPDPTISDDGFFAWLDHTVQGMGTQVTDYGLAYDFALFPDWITDLVTNVTNWSLDLMSGFTWLMELTFDFAELGLGLLLFFGIFTSFSALALMILSIVISVGSFVSYGMVVEGLLFSIFSSLALIGFGSRDYQPLSVDYYLLPYISKKRKISKQKKNSNQEKRDK